jgi:hypothetical protein
MLAERLFFAASARRPTGVALRTRGAARLTIAELWLGHAVRLLVRHDLVTVLVAAMTPTAVALPGGHRKRERAENPRWLGSVRALADHEDQRQEKEKIKGRRRRRSKAGEGVETIAR